MCLHSSTSLSTSRFAIFLWQGDCECGQQSIKGLFYLSSRLLMLTVTIYRFPLCISFLKIQWWSTMVRASTLLDFSLISKTQNAAKSHSPWDLLHSSHSIQFLFTMHSVFGNKVRQVCQCIHSFVDFYIYLFTCFLFVYIIFYSAEASLFVFIYCLWPDSLLHMFWFHVKNTQKVWDEFQDLFSKV